MDTQLNSKISDFGMAKISGSNQIQETTNRVVGTYGYNMSPEYAMDGLFSIKSDVFSFGVLLLEIITGRKNNSYHSENCINIIGHVVQRKRFHDSVKTNDVVPFRLVHDLSTMVLH
ncbi:hypothetical protein POM88_019378 [Heracleum sosnowskyi]|uniref:Protein kinase domain-containing protein n=1 Tax=Heracleum sosnowskyi TaxID=360622 RepID=A0AAD8LY59_9APIA|nr:hypothetical protein POM88_051901 [Heracleum sosnowskyi]KAK1391200.1 hypothetical protein POM88_019378 [Heracleum sosnowskyi]